MASPAPQRESRALAGSPREVGGPAGGFVGSCWICRVLPLEASMLSPISSRVSSAGGGNAFPACRDPLCRSRLVPRQGTGGSFPEKMPLEGWGQPVPSAKFLSLGVWGFCRLGGISADGLRLRGGRRVLLGKWHRPLPMLGKRLLFRSVVKVNKTFVRCTCLISLPDSSPTFPPCAEGVLILLPAH